MSKVEGFRFAQLGIGHWLLALALTSALPVLVFARIAAQRLAAAERQATIVDLEQRTKVAAEAVER